MGTHPADGKRTIIQKLPELIEWYLSSQEVELLFIPNPKKTGRLAPEYNFEYWKDDRRITERALAMGIQTEFARMNYDFSLGKIIGAMTGIAWLHYLAKQEYPTWFKDDVRVEHTKPVGRPRVRTKKIAIDEISVNTKPDTQDAQ